MGLQNIQVLKLAKTLANYLESEREYFSLKKIQKIISKDHILNVLMERAPLNSDKVKVIYATWFLLNRPNFKPETIIQIISNLYVIIIDWYDDTGTIKTECGNCGGDGYEDCDECDGNGRVDCRTCDGDELIWFHRDKARLSFHNFLKGIGDRARNRDKDNIGSCA